MITFQRYTKLIKKVEMQQCTLKSLRNDERCDERKFPHVRVYKCQTDAYFKLYEEKSALLVSVKNNVLQKYRTQALSL